MSKRIFTLDELKGLGQPHKHVWRDEGCDGRWTRHHTQVFEADGKHYRIDIELGLTEYQDLDFEDKFPDLNYKDKTVTCHEVEKYEEAVMVTKWRPVE